MVAETTKAMTLDDVMKLEGRELDAAVCKHIAWKGEPWRYSPIDGMPFDRPFGPPPPEFHHSWDAAMQVREWARGLDHPKILDFYDAFAHCFQERTGKSTILESFLWTEPIDLCRAALLVSP